MKNSTQVLIMLYGNLILGHLSTNIFTTGIFVLLTLFNLGSYIYWLIKE